MEAVGSAVPQARNELFQSLKPCCVKISQLAIRDSATPSANTELIELTTELLEILSSRTEVLDEKLAEYVFFPLYHIFRQLQQYPMLLIENCVKCLTILIIHGWKSKIAPKLVQQILTLLVFIIDGAPGSDRKNEVPEETIFEALRSLTSLFTVAESSATVASSLSESEVIPSLGHCVTVVLGCVANGASDAIQTQALLAIQAVYKALREQAALASFLPGTVSTLTKLLASPSRRKKAVISLSLDTVYLVLTRVLADIRTRSIRADKPTNEDDKKDNNTVLSPSWLKATTMQVKLALSTIMKLRTHDAPEIQASLRRLSLGLLDECHDTLRDCAYILVESAMVVYDIEATESLTETRLEDLVGVYPELGETAKSVLFDWMTSLPRILQGSDEAAKENAIQQLTKGIGMLQRLDIESLTLQDMLAITLKDSVTAIVHANKNLPDGRNGQVELIEQGGSPRAVHKQPEYAPVLIAHESERQVRKALIDLIKLIGSKFQHSTIASNMLDHARESASGNQSSAFWLCYEMVKAAESTSADEDALLDMAALTGSSESPTGIFDELYTFAVQILDSHSDSEPADWRLEAIALEVTCHAANKLGPSFRPELIDILFPVANFLGSENPMLREHAIVSLNRLASACNYSGVSELIIDNVDYMVNSVSLRLNTLDISPSSMKVLSMMIRLAGPRLVPFLDDVVDSIFSALENYHGYPKFVESLFAVLKEVVDQAAKSSLLMFEDRQLSAPNHLKNPARGQGLQGISELIRKRDTRYSHQDGEEPRDEKVSGHPSTPWKGDGGDDKDEDGLDNSGKAPPEEENPPQTPTYQLLLRIANLTQHHLTSPTPELRRSLLDLLSTASPALAADEDSFLPLVNAVWPVVISRLYDDEAYISVEACHALSELCATAGDFLSSRFKTEWWDGLGQWCRKVGRQAAQRSGAARIDTYPESMVGTNKNILIPVRGLEGLEAKKTAEQSVHLSSGKLGRHSSPAKLWEAVVKLLTSLISHVRVDEEIFDQIVDILTEALERSGDVRQALERVNADAVWLTRYEGGFIERPSVPVLDGVVFTQLAA